jgi:uncharacterized protein (TIGR02145 family)
MRNLALVWVLAGCLLGCGGRDKDAKDKAVSAADTAAVAADTVLAAAVAADTDTDTTFTDKRDGKVYRKVAIGSDVWMAENLNYEKGGFCYGYDTSNCAKYGVLYLDYYAANGACPDGWHLPLDAEWTALENYVGGSGTAGKKLKSTSGWKNKGNGTDDYGFSALPGGYGFAGGKFNGKFYNAGVRGIWWGLRDDDVYAEFRVEASITRTMYDDKYSLDREYSAYKTFLFSIRCVQDKEERK